MPTEPLVRVDESVSTKGRVSWSRTVVDGVPYQRGVVRTPWLGRENVLADALVEHLPPLDEGDTVVVSEKVMALLLGRTVHLCEVKPGRLARFLARHVHPRNDSCGLSVPEKMQYVLDSVGVTRVLTATAAAALTRPYGLHGVFYRVAGPLARDLDGARPPYEDRLFPPLPEPLAQQVCRELEEVVDHGVAIVDLNDYGGTIRAASPKAMPHHVLAKVLADNPLRQRMSSTPFAVVRAG